MRCRRKRHVAPTACCQCTKETPPHGRGSCAECRCARSVELVVADDALVSIASMVGIARTVADYDAAAIPCSGVSAVRLVTLAVTDVAAAVSVSSQAAGRPCIAGVATHAAAPLLSSKAARILVVARAVTDAADAGIAT